MAMKSWYDDGTASVANGSTAVTGAGTAWLSQISAGDVFEGKDGRSARIAEIVSNTSLTLARAWPGDSQVADYYEVRITPKAAEIVGASRELFEKLRQGLWLKPNAVGNASERAAYDAARRGFIFMKVDADPFLVYMKQSDTPADWSPGFAPQQGAQGIQGQKGWSIVTEIVADGERSVMRVADFVGGEGAKPAGIGLYIGDVGLVETAAEAANVKGHKGWAAQIELVTDGPDRVVMRISDYIGGEGTKPAGSGKYIGAAGLVDTAAEAVNVQGNEGNVGPRGVTFRGAWTSIDDYEPYDITIDDDINGDPAAWIALTANTNSQPRDNPTDWSLFPGSFPGSSDYGLITAAIDASRDYGIIA